MDGQTGHRFRGLGGARPPLIHSEQMNDLRLLPLPEPYRAAVAGLNLANRIEAGFRLCLDITGAVCFLEWPPKREELAPDESA